MSSEDEDDDMSLDHFDDDDDNDSHFDDSQHSDDDDDLGFQPVHAEVRRKAYHVEHDVLSLDAIRAQLADDAQHTSDLCGVPPSDAHVLLRHFAWNKETLVERFMEDSLNVLRQCGLATDNDRPPTLRDAPVGYICFICCSEATAPGDFQLVGMSCGHEFCRECYAHYLTQKIKEEGESGRIQCPGVKCNRIVDSRLIELVTTADVHQRYSDLLVRSYVDDLKIMRWCPAPNCEYAVKCSIRHTQLTQIIPTVKCHCNFQFCFGCGLADHQPCICSLTKMWLKKCQDDSETANWISAHTKECPKCQSTIEKNGGCNHMTCKKCKYEFCWVCMGPWLEHGGNFYNCNRYEEKSSIDARDHQAKSRVQLERYLHFFNRYANHEQSAKLANEFYMRTEKKMEEMQLNSDLSWIEVQFMKRALEVLLECRKTLKWTYALGYYLDRNNMTALFEDNQRDLEMAVESLNELVEKPVPGPENPQQRELLAELKQNVLDKTEYCARRRDVLLEDTCKGLSEGRWVYNVPL